MARNKKTPLKILMIMPALNVCGGMESFIMNYYRHIDRSRIIFDFITHSVSEKNYCDEIRSNGSKIYLFPTFSLRNLRDIKVEFDQVLTKGKYDVVHCNMANAAFLYLRSAKKLKVSLRILHSHQNKAADTVTHALRNIPLIAIGKKFCNVRFACSKEAGDYLFKNDYYHIVKNAIDYKKYLPNERVKEELRKNMELSKKIVFGHTGRLCKQKNQLFLIEVFAVINLTIQNSILLLIGDGESRRELEAKVKELNLSSKVLFMGSRENIPELLQVIDVFVFPSIYEGLGISLLEAQIAGKKCFCSDTIPHEVDISHSINFISLSKTKEYWAKIIIDNLDEKISDSVDNSYDIHLNSEELTNLYETLMTK